MDAATLEKRYIESLEERIIASLSRQMHLTLEAAMDLYYRSRLAQLIYEGVEGIQYLDHKVLAQLLIDTEPELIKNCAHGGLAHENQAHE